MAKPASEWTEDDVLALPAGESDAFERKGARKLDLTLGGVREGEVLDELAKQLSAFANSRGGRIIYGVADDGTVDSGGVARTVKGRQSTKDWLEDVVPKLTYFEILGFNIYEVMPKAAASLLAPDKSLYIIDVPDSERAPHQSARDLKYYVRFGGKSQPAPHGLVEDIRNRARHPSIDIEEIQLLAAGHHLTRQPPNSSQMQLQLQFVVHNKGNVRAQAAAGDKEHAIAWLEKAASDRPDTLPALKVEPVYDSLRGDSRFQALLRKVGLAP
jgi:hypothetical protein